ncbi:endolytic transglycosylase MltG [Pseudohaliea rubra]|uniref:Endolytic murein transglycosylase n=1 Tax=Pseudohaliea rubra DSM 19751 TaxID=1265313 RepID=A0A095VQG4_9GAMM|nr:endolytic transglycosylase MltG [Pseudohaliea rubra]KGE03580.1 protein YceG like type [Pseudohaliea rubra DSM 19751]
MRKRRLALGLLGLCLVAALGALWIVNRWQQPATLPTGGYRLVVGAGESLAGVSRRLQAEGIIENALLLELYGRYTGLDGRLHRGEYLLSGAPTAAEILDQLVAGAVIEYQVTLPEGITLAQALAILAREDPLESVLDGPRDPRLLGLAPERASAEGLFLPETYRYRRGESDWALLQRAHAALVAALGVAWEERAPELPLGEPYEALVLASIVERETGVPAERDRIAGVFVRRLLRGMRLQTDPTVIYGLGERYDGNLRREHLKDDSNPYNTYRHNGLPPTPIALPGRASLLAAVQPARGSALYFVARGDGSHVFSDTLEEHRRAVRDYQLRRRADYRSAPGPG